MGRSYVLFAAGPRVVIDNTLCRPTNGVWSKWTRARWSPVIGFYSRPVTALVTLDVFSSFESAVLFAYASRELPS